MLLRALARALLVLAAGAACGQGDSTPSPSTSASTAPSASAPAPPAPSTSTSAPPAPAAPKVHVVFFTHIEDNTPAGDLAAPAARVSYLALRARLLEAGAVMKRLGVPWALQPDWKFLLAAQRFEDATVTASTGGRNVLLYLRDALGVRIDPHSHENGGYNYTDVAQLLTELGVGGSTVIGGHIWDPSLPQFSHWERFRAPVAGQRFPTASWRGDLLMGSGTPNHVNDPIVSGVWRPKDPDHYFEDDPGGNIAAIGAFRHDLPGVLELVERYRSGATAPGCLLTSSQHVPPAELLGADAMQALETRTLAPMVELRDRGVVALTDFTALAETWRRDYGARACLYEAK